MSKQYLVVMLICAVLHKHAVLSTEAKTYARNGIVNNTIEVALTGAGNNSTKNTTSSIVAEGGHIKLNPEPVVHHGRENVVIVSSTTTQKPDSSKVTASTNATTNSTKLNTTVSASVSTTTVLPTPLTTSSVTKSTTLLSETSLPVEVHGDSKIKPRKGVDMNLTPPESNGTVSNSTVQTSTTPVVTNATVVASNTTSTTVNATTATTIKASTTPSTTTVKPKKPTVTISSDDEPPLVRVPPKVIMNNKVLQPKNITVPLPILVAGGEQVISNRQLKKGPDYVLPIVLTILAVPLLAIILTVVYKRGAEWWQHRHYRRMDFLIDGMYNN